MPVQVSGWKTLPSAGDEVFEIENEVKLEYRLSHLNNKEKICYLYE